MKYFLMFLILSGMSFSQTTNRKNDKGLYKLQDTDNSDLSKLANKIANPGDFTEPLPVSSGYSIFKL